MLKPIHLFLTLAFINSIAIAQEFSLSQAREFALVNYYEAKNADLDLKIAKKKIWETTAIGLPQVSGSASYRNAFDLEFEFPDAALQQPGNEFLSVFAADNVTKGQLDATQLLFDGTYIVGLRAAKTYYQLSEDKKVKSFNEIKANVSSAYYLVLVARENIKIVEKSLTTMSKVAKETEAIVGQGLMDEMEYDQIQLSVNKLKSNLLNAQRMEQIALAMLKLNMGYEQEKEILLSDSLNGIINSVGIDALENQEFNSALNPDLNLLSTQRILAKLDVQRYKMQRLPSLAAFYSAANTAYQTEFNFYKNATWYSQQNLGVSLNIPIWSSGMQGAKIQQAKLALLQTDNSIAHFENAIKVQFNNASSQLNTKLADKQNAKKSLEIAQRIYSRTIAKHKEGLTSSLELSQTESQLQQAQGTYINAIFELLNAKVELDKLQNKL